MHEKREPTKILEKACPLCHGDLKGNDKILYYCRRCNLMFKKRVMKHILP